MRIQSPRSSGTCSPSSPRSPSTAKSTTTWQSRSCPLSGRWRDRQNTGLTSPEKVSTSVIFGDAPPPASAREYGLWRPGKKRLPQRIRQEVFVQREMSELLEKIIDTAHFQDEGKPEEVEKEQKLKAPHQEAWPTLEFPLTWAPLDWDHERGLSRDPPIFGPEEAFCAFGKTDKTLLRFLAEKVQGPPADVDILLQQSNLYSPATPQKSVEIAESSKPNSRQSSKQPAEDQSRLLSKRRQNSKKPAVPKSKLKQSPSGWQHLRMAATALRPFGGLSDAVKKTSKDKLPQAEEEEEEKEPEVVEEEGPKEDQEVKPVKTTLFDICWDLSKQYLVPLEEVKKILDEFKQIDTSGDMLISPEEFEASARQNMGWSKYEEIPAEVQARLKRYFKEMDKDSSDTIDFPEFFDWSLKHRWTEEFLARDEKDLENRNVPGMI
eukprot:s707_g7.t1